MCLSSVCRRNDQWPRWTKKMMCNHWRSILMAGKDKGWRVFFIYFYYYYFIYFLLFGMFLSSDYISCEFLSSQPLMFLLLLLLLCAVHKGSRENSTACFICLHLGLSFHPTVIICVKETGSLWGKKELQSVIHTHLYFTNHLRHCLGCFYPLSRPILSFLSSSTLLWH